METSFPARHDLLIIALFAGLFTGCGTERNYNIEPRFVDTLTVDIDSSCTVISMIKTGLGDSLYCGKKSNYNSYSMVYFDSIPYEYDSIFLKIYRDSTTNDLYVYRIKQSFSEDSLYEWSELGDFIDTNNVLDTFNVNSTDPEFELVDTTFIDSIRDYGMAFYSENFFSFASRESRAPKLTIFRGDTSSILSCEKDLFLSKNPFSSSLPETTDIRMVGGGGISVRIHFAVPGDSLSDINENIARLGLMVEVDTLLPYNLVVYDTSGIGSAEMRTYGDSLQEYNLIDLVNGNDLSDGINLRLNSIDEPGTFRIDTLGYLQLKIMWAEIDDD